MSPPRMKRFQSGHSPWASDQRTAARHGIVCEETSER
jgi:hypothetical protein